MARLGVHLGLALGVVYAFGGLVIDLMTTGWTTGTALAFLALPGMPLLFGGAAWLLGVLAGLLQHRRDDLR